MVRTLVGTRIRERRRAQKLTQTKLAASVGISASYLNLIEHNKRGIAGKTLLTIARALNMEPRDLTEGSDGVLLSTLSDTAKDAPNQTAELDRIEEFVGRYPGWAKLLANLAETARDNRERLTALSDQMAHDPFLSETMHQILSNITAIRSTAGILSTADDIPPDLYARFLSNLHKDSQRLSETAEAMVNFFDRPADAPDAPQPAGAQQNWEALATSHVELAPLGPQAAPVCATRALQVARSIETVSEEEFCRIADQSGWDPRQISQQLDADPYVVLLRLAQREGAPEYGLIECDMSGAVLLRKDTPELTLPQYSSACPLWPLYRAFSRPHQLIRATLELPTGNRLLTYSYAYAMEQDSYDLPPKLCSVMVFTTDRQVLSKGGDQNAPILAGLHCSVCPRKSCADRRADYILA